MFGEDLDRLRRSARTSLAWSIRSGRGRRQVGTNERSALFRMRIRRDEIARYGINASQVLDVVRTMAGVRAGEVP